MTITTREGNINFLAPKTVKPEIILVFFRHSRSAHRDTSRQLQTNWLRVKDHIIDNQIVGSTRIDLTDLNFANYVDTQISSN